MERKIRKKRFMSSLFNIGIVHDFLKNFIIIPKNPLKLKLQDNAETIWHVNASVKTMLAAIDSSL